MNLLNILHCCCCGCVCGDKYKVVYIDEETEDEVQIVDSEGSPEYLCCECAG